MNIDFNKMIFSEAKLQMARDAGFSRLAELRWAQETMGLDLPDGRRTLTTREAQSQISLTAAALRSGEIEAPITWKLVSGWCDLTAEEFATLAAAVHEHVRRCFAAENTVEKQMQALPGDLNGFDILAKFEAAYHD